MRRRDADDPKSPHWINPQHGLFFSKQPVAFEEVPRCNWPGLSLGQSLEMALLDIGLLGLFNVLFFAASYTAFLRYDVR